MRYYKGICILVNICEVKPIDLSRNSYSLLQLFLYFNLEESTLSYEKHGL